MDLDNYERITKVRRVEIKCPHCPWKSQTEAEEEVTKKAFLSLLYDSTQVKKLSHSFVKTMPMFEKDLVSVGQEWNADRFYLYKKQNKKGGKNGCK